MDIQAVMTRQMTAGGMPGVMAREESGFGAVLAKATSGTDTAKKRAEAEEAAAGLVANALILPVLKQVRRSTFNKEGPFSPGNGEKTFGPEFDMEIADRLAHSPHLGIKEALAERLMKRG